MLSKNINKNNTLRAILSSSVPPLIVYTVAMMCSTLNIFEIIKLLRGEFMIHDETMNSSWLFHPRRLSYQWKFIDSFDIKIRTVCVFSLGILEDIKEQHIFVEYLINKCYPCIDYSMASHHLCIQEPHHTPDMVNRGDNSSKNKSSKYNIRHKVGRIVTSWIIKNEKCPQPCIWWIFGRIFN